MTPREDNTGPPQDRELQGQMNMEHFMQSQMLPKTKRSPVFNYTLPAPRTATFASLPSLAP